MIPSNMRSLRPRRFLITLLTIVPVFTQNLSNPICNRCNCTLQNITCIKPNSLNSLTSLSLLSKKDGITSITIKNQPGFLSPSSDELNEFSSLENLFLANNGLLCQCDIWKRGIQSKNATIQCNENNIVLCATPHIRDFRYKSDFCIHYDVFGMPEPELSFIKDEKLITGDNPHFTQRNFTTSSGELKGCLVARNSANWNNNGKYTIVAKNLYGHVNSTRDFTFHQEHPGLNNYNQPIRPPFFGSPVNITQTETIGILHYTSLPVVINNSTVDDQSQSALTGGTIGACFIAVLFSITFIKFRRQLCKRVFRQTYKPAQQSQFHLTTTIAVTGEMPLSAESIFHNPNYQQPEDIPLLPHLDVNYIPANGFTLHRKLGEGEFGTVFLATCLSLVTKGETTTVAAKTLKNGTKEEVLNAFAEEASLLGLLKHKNIVHFFGVCVESNPIAMLFEYMTNGDLNYYLRYHSPDAPLLFKGIQNCQVLIIPELLFIGTQIADGMSYLAERHYIHRDLATRNCLVGERLLVKISDFGMCKDIYFTDYYKVSGNNLLPIRWMAPESLLYRQFTVESDIWSMGVVLWEIFTYGKQPWYEYSNSQVIGKVQNGDILPQPRNCLDEIYKIMLECWVTKPSDRTHMKHIHQVLDKLCLAHSDYTDVVG